MTKSSEPLRRCAYCRRPLPAASGSGRPGRPRTYCTRSHRQRAYEARQRAARAALPEGDVIVTRADLDRLHDRLYALEAALDDVAADTADLDGASAARRARTYAGALAHVQVAAEDLRGLVVEPVGA